MATLESIIHHSIKLRELRDSLQRQLKESSIVFNDLEIIYAISLKNEITPSEVASYLSCERATVSRTLSNLEKKSIIARRYDTADRRIVLLKLSPKGKRLLKAFMDVI